MVQRDYVAGIGTQIAAVFGFVTNFFEMATGGSYESNFIPHLFLHTWSLALEVHYYVLWALLAWFLAKRTKTVGKYRGMLFLASSGLFLFTFLSMFIRAFLTANFSTIYFSSFTHIFPFFAGSCLATVTGIANVSPNFTKLVQSWSMKRPYRSWVEALPSCLCSVFSCHLIACGPICLAFLAATIAACAMILSARILHEKTPDKKEPAIPQFLGRYQLWRLPFPLAFLYHLLSTFGKYDGSPCDDDRFLDSNGSFLLYFGANHCRQGASCLWYEDGSEFLTKPIFTS